MAKKMYFLWRLRWSKCETRKNFCPRWQVENSTVTLKFWALRSKGVKTAVGRKGADSNLPPFFVMVSLRFYHRRPKQVKRQVNLFYLEARYNLCGYSNSSITSTIWSKFTTNTVSSNAIPHNLIDIFSHLKI